jgi:tRNA (guanine-N7-)-methyltransferase
LVGFVRWSVTLTAAARLARTYLRHRGRPTRAQARALAASGSELIVEGPGCLSEFDRIAPVGVEVGFGMGHALLDWASQRADWNLLGIEVYQPGIGALLLGVERLALTNVRVIADDAGSALERCFASASIDEVRIFFPDPWPKRRHHKRRLIQAEFASVVAGLMRPEGKLLVATDWQDYARAILKVLDQEPLLTNLAGTGSFSERPATRPLTRFEDRGRKLGHQVWDLAYERNR